MKDIGQAHKLFCGILGAHVKMMVDQCFLNATRGRYEDTRGPSRSFTISYDSTTYSLYISVLMDSRLHLILSWTTPAFSPPSLVL